MLSPIYHWYSRNQALQKAKHCHLSLPHLPEKASVKTSLEQFEGLHQCTYRGYLFDVTLNLFRTITGYPREHMHVRTLVKFKNLWFNCCVIRCLVISLSQLEEARLLNSSCPQVCTEKSTVTLELSTNISNSLRIAIFRSLSLVVHNYKKFHRSH